MQKPLMGVNFYKKIEYEPYIVSICARCGIGVMWSSKGRRDCRPCKRINQCSRM